MEIIKNFGIEPAMLGAQIINFLIIFYILKRFAYKPIFEMLEKRKQTIAEGLVNAQKTQALLEKTQLEEKKILSKAQAEGQKIVADTKKQAALISEQMIETAKEKVEKLLTDAKKEMAQQEKDIEKRLATHTMQLASDMLQKTLTGFFDKDEQTQVMEKIAQKLKK